MSAGVRPETATAKTAGVKCGACGGIEIDDNLRTNVPYIWAVGDACETTHPVTGKKYLALLAGPAGRCGRMCADNISHTMKNEPLVLVIVIFLMFIGEISWFSGHICVWCIQGCCRCNWSFRKATQTSR